MKKTRVLVLCGGISSEREISLRSGEAVAAALLEAGFDVEKMDLTRENVAQIAEKKPDVVFPALHGAFGEDGAIQGVLEWLGIPYVGSGIAASAVCMDKLLTKKLFVAEKVPTARFLEFQERPADTGACARDVIDKLGLPFVCKAARQGSSIGVVIVRKKEDAESALSEVFSLGDPVLCEAFLSGTELTVPVMGNREITVLPVIEIVSEGEFYDFASKYTPGQSHHILPARISPETEQEVRAIAARAYRAAGCRGFARVDVMLDGKGMPHAVEINTLPGMTGVSLFPDAARAAGISFPELCRRLVELALETKR